MSFPDSAFAALRLPLDGADEPLRWGRLLLALALTIVAAGTGLLAGG